MGKRAMKKKSDVKKRSQVTVFIIIAIIIVGIILVIFLVRKNSDASSGINPQVKPIYSYVQNCIRDTGENAIYYVGQTGGYFTSPNDSTEFGIAYYYDRGKNNMPTTDMIAKEIGDYMNYMLFYCTQNFSNFSGFNVKQDKIKTNVKIESGKVVLSVYYPLSITKDKKTYTFNKFEDLEIPVRLTDIFTLATNITDDHMKNGNNICISCMYNWARAMDLYVEMNDYPDNVSVIYTIRDANSEILQKDYRFNFANRYTK
jgi:hypothetical protein